MKRLLKRIHKNPGVLDTLPFEKKIFDIIAGFAQELGNNPGETAYINAVLKYLLSGAYENPDVIPVIEEALSRSHANGCFYEWFRNRSLAQLGESLAVRCLKLICLVPSLGDGEHLHREFLLLLGRADLYRNPPDRAADHIFSALTEAVACLPHEQGLFPANDAEFNSKFSQIEQDAQRTIETLQDTNTLLPEKFAGYSRTFSTEESWTDRRSAIFFEILLEQAEERNFLAGLSIPVSYLLFFIALDERRHFSPLVRQSAIAALRNASAGYFWGKIRELRGDFFNVYGAVAPVVSDTGRQEIARSIGRALWLLDAEYECNTIAATAAAVLEIPDSRDFLYNHPLKITSGMSDELLSSPCFSLVLSVCWSDKNISSVKRRMEIHDRTLPNSRGIPATLFNNENLVLPFIFREYLCFQKINNEAEIRLRTAASCALFQGRLDPVQLAKENPLHAKIISRYIEPIHRIFRINAADEETLARINEYIENNYENNYGNTLSAEQAVEKARAVIDAENEKIAVINKELDGNAWPLLQEDSHQWVRLFTMLVKRYSGRNTLTLWEFRGVLYDLKNKQSGFFFRPAEAAAGVIRRAVSVFEQDRLRSKKVRQRLYRYIYNCIDRLETNIDVCGWKENGGKCLRHDYRCCTVHVTCKHYKDSQCVSEALTCKFWLCHAAIARASATGKGRFLLALRHILNFWCRALNIPLKIRCSFVESFDDNAKGRFTDVPEGDWYNKKY